MNIQQRFQWYGQRLKELEEEKAENGGVLPRHEWWRIRYYNNPFLMFCDDKEVNQRFVDVFSNTSYINEEGRISPELSKLNEDNNFMIAFTQIVEECNSRGGLQFDMVERGREELLKYFEHGDPPGVAMFSDHPKRRSNTIVKFSKRQHLEDALKKGRIKVSPASYYSKGSLLKSMKDLETERVFRVPAWRQALAGDTHVKVQGYNLPIDGGAVTLPVEIPNYYLFSTCLDFDRRMPTDFNADSALVIKDAKRFVKEFKREFSKVMGPTNFGDGPVSYYDPFGLKYRKHNRPVFEMMKHFAYSYQKEHRIWARPKSGTVDGDAVFIEIGSMEDYAYILPKV